MSHAADITPGAGEHVDAWHSHAGEAPPQEMHGTVSPLAITMIGIVGTVVLVALILVLVFYFDRVYLEQYVEKKERWDVRGEARSVEAQWTQELSGYRWADPQAGTVAMPITDAMNAVASDYSAR